MSRLQILLMGPLQITLDLEPVVGFESDRVRALLVFLAAGVARPHSREVVAELLWPERPRQAALANLRHSLANLRHAIGDQAVSSPFLLLTPGMLQLNAASDVFVGLADFDARFGGLPGTAPSVDDCRGAIALYRGSFLDEFALDDSPAFEEWLVVMRERLAHGMTRALSILARHAATCGDFGEAAEWTRRQVALEPWNEEAHRQLMTWLALSGQHSAALHHFATCRRLLATEAGMEPQPETIELAQRICDQPDRFRPHELDGAGVRDVLR